MVQCDSPRLDASFAAISDATRRGILERLGRDNASISELASRFQMTLTGMKKHIGVLEGAGLVATEKVGRTRVCSLGPRVMDEELTWMANYRALWDSRFSALDQIVAELKSKENGNG